MQCRNMSHSTQKRIRMLYLQKSIKQIHNEQQISYNEGMQKKREFKELRAQNRSSSRSGINKRKFSSFIINNLRPGVNYHQSLSVPTTPVTTADGGNFFDVDAVEYGNNGKISLSVSSSTTNSSSNSKFSFAKPKLPPNYRPPPKPGSLSKSLPLNENCEQNFMGEKVDSNDSGELKIPQKRPPPIPYKNKNEKSVVKSSVMRFFT